MNRGQFDMARMGQVSGGVSKQVLNGKGTFKFNINDMFNTGKQSGVVHIQNTDARFTQTRDNRAVNLGFTYRFGKPLKTQQRKSGGAGDEQNRIKSN